MAGGTAMKKFGSVNKLFLIAGGMAMKKFSSVNKLFLWQEVRP